MSKYFKHSLMLVTVLLLGCKKTKLEGDFAVLIGNWKHIATYQINNSYYPPGVPLPTHTENYIPVTTESSLEISSNAFLSLFSDGQKVFEEDFHVDKIEENQFRIHYYGSKHSKGTQYVDVKLQNDTLIIHNFFPNTATAAYAGGHGGQTSSTYTNYFKKQ